MIRSDKMRTTYEIDCLKFSKLSISSPPNSRKEYRSTSSTVNNNNNHHISNNNINNHHNHHNNHHHHHHHHHHNHHHHNSHHGHQTAEYRNVAANNNYKPLLPRIEFPTNQFDRLLHMDQKEFKNSWRSSSASNAYENEKKKK